MNKFIAVAEKCGAKVHKAIQLGSFLHVDTNKSCESIIIEMMNKMGAKQIKVLDHGADGKHLDGSKHHRIVAKF